MKQYFEGCCCLKVMGRILKLFSKVNFDLEKRLINLWLVIGGKAAHCLGCPENSSMFSRLSCWTVEMECIPEFILNSLSTPISLMTSFRHFFHFDHLLFVVKERFN